MGSKNANQSECDVGSRPIALSFHIPNKIVKICIATNVSFGNDNLLSMNPTLTGDTVSYLSKT